VIRSPCCRRPSPVSRDVPADQVLSFAERDGATSFDAKGARYTADAYPVASAGHKM